MDMFGLFQRLGLALTIGFLVGLERGWQERDGADGSRTAGIRTYALIGLLGGVWGALTPKFGPLPLTGAGLAFAAAFTLFQWREATARNDFSVTSVIAGLIVFALGAFAVLGDMSIAGAAGVATMVLLIARTELHAFLRRLTWPELRSAALLLVVTFILLPILPDRTIDPFGAFNPHELWLMTVLIGGVSFLGYAAVRALGDAWGLLVSAAAGALVSSTTVTLNNSRLAAQNKTDPNGHLAVAICVAWIVGVIRMTAIAGILNWVLLRPLVPPVAAGMAVLAVAAFYFYRRAGTKETPVILDLNNPLDISWVLGFGALLSVVVVGAKLLIGVFGQPGLLVMAGISGFADVDPITLATARLAGISVTIKDAADAILLAAAANMLTKMALPVVIGGKRFGIGLALSGGLALIAGALVLALGGV